MTTLIRLQQEAFDAGAEAARMTRGRTDIGAVVTFTGVCRGDENGEAIAALTLEHYPGMAETEIARHVGEAQARWPLFGVAVIHRYGRIAPGEPIVLVSPRRATPSGVPSQSIAALTLEHYPGMAETEIARHVGEAQARWPLFGVAVIHRYGRIAPGEPIVLVVTASSHRQAAFAAAEFLMDYLKTRAPFWKQVEKTSGAAAEKTLVEKTWVEAKSADDAAVERWAPPPPSRAAAK